MAKKRAIEKDVRLKLDKRAAEQMEQDAGKHLGGVDRGLGKLKGAAVALGAAIAAAFSIGLLKRFGQAAVAEARKAEVQYSRLAASVENAGHKYEDLVDAVNAAASAFEANTTYDDGEYAEGLQTLISLTGDVTASMHNMGLVADVAATFFEGELAPAADVVGKAMAGNFTALQRLGIQAKSAQEALDVLATRSYGAAAREANTYDGMVKQNNVALGNFVKEVGFAILAGDGLAESQNIWGQVIALGRQKVEENKETIAAWVTGGIRLAITATDALIRTILGLSQLVAGGFRTSLGATVGVLNFFVRTVNLGNKAAAVLWDLLGNEERSRKAVLAADRIDALTEALDRWKNAQIEAGQDLVSSGLGQFTRTLFDPSELRTPARSLQTGAPAVPGGPGGDQTAPPAPQAEEQVGRIEGLTDRVVVALERFGDAQRVNRDMQQLLGEDFDALAAEASSLETAINDLILAGLDPADDTLAMMRDRLREVRGEMEGMTEASRLEEEALRAQAGAAHELAAAMGAAMAGGLAPFAQGKAKQNLLEAAELSLRAVAAALTGFGAGRAGAYLALAGKHTALAGAWGALGSMIGGGSGGGGGGTAGALSPALTPSVARDTSNRSSDRQQAMGAEVSVYLIGEGFDAMNPRVARVVRGAVQQAGELYGPNTRTRVVRGGV